eukprot:11227803-Lingulodinium_polyedra.AAC.1
MVQGVRNLRAMQALEPGTHAPNCTLPKATQCCTEAVPRTPWLRHQLNARVEANRPMPPNVMR